MKTYWATVAFIVAPREEKALHIEFKAKSRKAAAKDAVRFAKNREKTFEGWEFSCLKLGLFDPEPIAADGSYQQASLCNFFEWKYDWPGTIEERIEVLSERE